MPRRLAIMVLIIVMVSIMIPWTVSGQAGDEEDSALLVFMGDMVFDRIIGDLVQAQGTQYPFEPMKPYIQDGDLVFGNLETPLSKRGQEEEGKYCTFRSDPDTVNCLLYAGVDAVSLANNHCLDYGHDALNDTLMYLDKAGIGHAGIWYDDPADNASIARPVILTANGMRFGFLAYTEDVRGVWNAEPDRAGPMPLDRSLMKADINYARDRVDILIVSIHWRKWPQYTQGPEPSDRDLCHDLVDWGADIIMGHGPHTVHEVEGYGSGLILYSLGNCAMDCGNETSDYSYIARVIVRDGKVQAFTLVPMVKDSYRYVPHGTPLARSSGQGFNATRSEVFGMYAGNVLNNTAPEDDYEHNAWMIWRSSDPWYYKALSVFVLLVSVAVIAFILYSVFKYKGRSLLNLEEEFNGPSYQGMPPGAYPGGEQRQAQDQSGNAGPGNSGKGLRGGGKGEDSGDGNGKTSKR